MPRSRSGSIRETRPGVWVVRASDGTYMGKQRRVSKTVHGDRRDAELALNALQADLTGTLPDAEMTLREYFHAVFLPTRRNLTENTRKSYESHFRNHIEPTFGDKPLQTITRRSIQRWLSELPPTSARNYMKTMSAVMNGAVEDGCLETPLILTHMRYPRRVYENPLDKVWGVEEAKVAFEVLEGDRVYPVWLAMIGAGLSRSEACALTSADLEWTGGLVLVNVHKAKVRYDGIKEPKNPFRQRIVPLVEPFGSRLHSIADGELWPWKPDWLSVSWRRLFDEGKPLDGLPYIPINNMRHTHATLMQSLGVPDTVNARLHGHASVQTSYRHYLGTGLEPLEAASDKLSELITCND